MNTFKKDRQYIKFCAYGFLKNLRFYDAFLLLFFLENGASYAQIGILYATREIVINVFEIPSGIVADTYGRKHSLLAAFASYILSFLVFYYSTNFQLLLMAMILYGIADAFRSGTHKGMIMDYLKLKGWEEHKVIYYGHTRSWSQKGSAISALFAGCLVFYSGNYRMIYLFSIIPYLFNFWNLFTYPQELNYTSKKLSKRNWSDLKSIFGNFSKAIREPKVFQVMNSAALHSAYLKAIKDYIQIVMVQVAILLPVLATVESKQKNGLIIGIIYFLIFLLTASASKNAFRVNQLRDINIPKWTLLFGLGAGIISGVLITYDVWVISLFSFIIIYLIENIRKPIMTGLLADQVENKILTSVLSAQSFYATIMTALIAIGFGFLADRFGIGVSLISISGLLFLFILFIGIYSKDGE